MNTQNDKTPPFRTPPSAFPLPFCPPQWGPPGKRAKAHHQNSKKLAPTTPLLSKKHKPIDQNPAPSAQQLAPRNSQLATLFSLCTLLTSLLLTTATAAPPNIVIFLADDQGWGDLSHHGNKNLSTPNIDSLADDGASFDRFFVCPVCAPTRAEFLTGRYHPRSQVYGVSTGRERMNIDEQTIAQVFQNAGYATAAFGKWHNGTQFPYHPHARGFGEYYGFCSGHWANYFNPLLDHNGQMVTGNGYITDDLTTHAIDFIKENKDQPFLAYLPYNTPHSPMQVPDRWWDKFADKKLQMPHRYAKRESIPHTRAALAMCENIDWNVGRVLETLDELELADNTIVVYFSDNGPNGFRWNDEMRGKKGSTDEGGIRSPLFIRWPEHVPAGLQFKQIAGAIDLLPTLAELTGVELNSPKPLDGLSLADALLKGKSKLDTDRMIFSHWNNSVSVRTQQFRLDHEGKLYDMQKDPGQQRDATKQHPKVAAKLKMAQSEWKAEQLVTRTKELRPFLVGHSSSRYTQLPARDSTTKGNLKRSSRHPNCSFFSNWKKTSDKVIWNVEVVEPGEYEAEIYYACAKKDVGSTLELRLGDSKLTGKIRTPNDQPLRGQEHDRVDRGEGYFKDFRPTNLGTIELAAGTGQLILQATDIPGETALDFRLLVLTRSE